MQIGLQLERGDVAAESVRQEARRPADARPNIEHAAGRAEAEVTARRFDGVYAVIVPLVETEELLGAEPIARTDAFRRQAALDAVDVGIERHRSDAGAFAHLFLLRHTTCFKIDP